MQLDKRERFLDIVLANKTIQELTDRLAELKLPDLLHRCGLSLPDHLESCGRSPALPRHP